MSRCYCLAQPGQGLHGLLKVARVKVADSPQFGAAMASGMPSARAFCLGAAGVRFSDRDRVLTGVLFFECLSKRRVSLKPEITNRFIRRSSRAALPPIYRDRGREVFHSGAL